MTVSSLNQLPLSLPFFFLTVVAFLSKTCLQLNAFDSQNLIILVYGDENF